MIGFVGETLPVHVREWLEQGLAGVFYFPPNGNYVSAAQVRALSDEIHGANPDCVIAIDQEGGRVQAWGPPHFDAQPSARALGQQGSMAAHSAGQRIGRELRKLGIDLNFAPVLDVDTRASNPIIGDRSFSADPQAVVELARDFAEGMASEGVLSCGKHFPGHGDTSRDSHLELPVVDRDRTTLAAAELLPFAKLADVLPMMMSAHVVYPALDPLHAATHSKRIMSSLLRDELGFDGVLISDDLAMKGIRTAKGDVGAVNDLPTAATAALQAGCDLVLSAFEHDDHPAMFDAIRRALADGRLDAVWQSRAERRIAGLQRRRAEISRATRVGDELAGDAGR
jgi:beta-N-acetylhexosaminidase